MRIHRGTIARFFFHGRGTSWNVALPRPSDLPILSLPIAP